MKTLLMGLCLCLGSWGAMLLGQPAPVQSNENEQRVIILLGPPGSGKGTQALKISKEWGIPHISTGDLFRENIKGNTPIGAKAKSYMDAGKLVPDEVVLEMLFERLSRPDAAKGYLLDGSPRTIAQAEAIEKHLPKNAKVLVLHIAVPDEAIVERIAGRLSCRQCSNIQHVKYSPPKQEGVCDCCGGELFQRADDKPETVKERLRVYHEQTEPLVEFYTKRGTLVNIEGNNKPDQVFVDLVKAYQKRYQ